MSEMPMALALVLAIRCWTNGWLTCSCLIAGFLPSLRPEGFFFGIIWGVMALHHVWRTRRGWLLLPALAVGLLAWIGACVYWTGDWLHVYHVWDWPRKTYEGYGRGSIFHYVIWWPVYCGGPMTVLFLAGLRPSWCKAMRLPWVAFGAVFGVHSILYWGGWFCSCGLLRILACVAPITALVALHGWNRLADLLRQRGEWNAPRLRRAGIVVALIATVWTLAHYCLDRSHYDCFPLLRCTAYVRDHQLLHADTWFFSGNQIADADLDLPPRRPHVMDSPCDPPKIARLLAKLPVGAIGIWDDRQAPIWHGHTIEDLAGHGFTILYETSERHLGRELRYAVLRKDGAFTPKHK